MQMRTITLTLLAAIGVATAAFGRVGEDEKQIELEAKSIAEEAPALQENYGIPSLQRLE